MHLLKLVYEHDIPLDRLHQSPDERRAASDALSLEDFLRPQPVFSHFYLTGTVMDGENRFGLSALPQVGEIIEALGHAIDRPVWQTQVASFARLRDALGAMAVGEAATAAAGVLPDGVPPAAPARNSGEPEVVAALHGLLKAKAIVVYKEQAHHGWDLQIYSLDNIYPALFERLKPFLSKDLRFFSMNGKRVRSERMYYFETWALDRPPHGVEEVFGDTKI